MDYLTKTNWGGRATVTAKELLAHPEEWRNNLYERKMLVLKGLTALSPEEFWQLHTIWGMPWNEAEYKTSTERCQDIGGGKFITSYGNKITEKSIGNRQMPWHRDIPWHRGKRYPIRTLYPVSMTLGAGATGTRFCDCDVLLNRLSPDNKALLLQTEVEIHSWYQLQHGVAQPQRQWIPLVEKHPETKRGSILLNSFGPRDETLEHSTAITGTWILDARVRGEAAIEQPLKWINYLHSVAVTDDNCYTHNWKMGDLVLFDNYSGIFHSRDRVVAEPDAERLFWRMNLKHYWQTT
jgi:alpha-ketoglutarate-dependent taurine dioxygenase